MQTHSLLGPAAPELGWVPAPRYLLRRRRILRQLRAFSPCAVLEVGCGAGMLLRELAARGFRCTALETSPQARSLIRSLGERYGNAVEVHDTAQPDWAGRFPLVMAFEVLEHIEDDDGALAQWASWLALGGTLLMSVPAHPRQWNAADVWAGHYRRYRKHDLKRLVARAGLELEHIECFGFPLGNLTERMQARGIAKRSKSELANLSQQASTDRSGVERGHVMRWFPLMHSWPGRVALRAAFALQAMSCGLPLGNGYLLRARRHA